MEIKPDAVLSIDIGTTAIKVGLFSFKGSLLKMAAREQSLLQFGEGRVEQAPDESWELIVSGVREVMQNQDPSRVKAIGLSLQRGTVVPLDAKGNPLSNLIVWMDKRSRPIANRLSQEIGNEAYYNVCGHPISYITGLSKVLWINQFREDIFPQLAVIAPPETLFLKRLGCEELVCSDSTGTYLFPFEIEKKDWSEELARKLQFPLEMLPRLASSTEIVGYLSESASDILGLVPGIPLVPGGGDGQCAAVGCGVVQPGLCMINIGTATGVQTYLPQPLRDPRCILNCAAHVVPDAWEMEGHTQCSGAVFRWWRDEFGAAEMNMERRSGVDAFDLLVEEAVKAPPAADGLLFLPTYNGSTAPIMDQSARGAFLGLGLHHSRSHLIRALLEGVSFEISWMMDAIMETGALIREIRLVGGGSKNTYWNQIHADILGRPVKTLHVTEAALVGAAMCAVVAAEGYKDLSEAAEYFVQVKNIIEPQSKTAHVYGEMKDNYRKAFRLLSESGIFMDLQQVGAFR